MNERIKELSERVLAENYAIPDYSMKLYTEKFAELIIKECITVSERHAKDLASQPSTPDWQLYDEGIVCGIYEATEIIKEHFGVE